MNELMEALNPPTIERYANYIKSIQPQNDWQVAKRWIFAFCSIHTTWQANVNGYLAVTSLGQNPSEEQIVGALKEVKAGLHVNKGRAIYTFLQDFWVDPNKYSFKDTPKVKALRDTLARLLFGIGLAKTSFACELINPVSKITCIDTHMLQWVHGHNKLNGKMNVKQYRLTEAKWLKATSKYGYNPIAARHATWDRFQGKSDMRYWSYVLEE
jgi:hypothetical protein